MNEILLRRGPLLNFWVAPFELSHPHTGEATTYTGVEWRFQAMKTTCLLAIREFSAVDLHAWVGLLPTRARDAKERGRALEIDVAKWDRQAQRNMLEALVAKFSQNPDLRELLLETGDARLVERSRDRIWGDGNDGTGRNLQGKLLMRTRSLLR